MFKFSKSTASLWVLLVLVATASLSGCGGDTRMSRLAGTWKLDLEQNDSLVDNLMDGQVPEKGSFTQKLALESAKNLVKSKLNELGKKLTEKSDYTMILQFGSDGTWSSTTNFPMAKGEKSGLWKVVNDTEDSMEISTRWTDSKSGKTDSTRTTIQFIDAKTIRLVPPNISSTEMELTFVRQTAK